MNEYGPHASCSRPTASNSLANHADATFRHTTIIPRTETRPRGETAGFVQCNSWLGGSIGHGNESTSTLAFAHRPSITATSLVGFIAHSAGFDINRTTSESELELGKGQLYSRAVLDEAPRSEQVVIVEHEPPAVDRETVTRQNVDKVPLSSHLECPQFVDIELEALVRLQKIVHTLYQRRANAAFNKGA